MVTIVIDGLCNLSYIGLIDSFSGKSPCSTSGPRYLGSTSPPSHWKTPHPASASGPKRRNPRDGTPLAQQPTLTLLILAFHCLLKQAATAHSAIAAAEAIRRNSSTGMSSRPAQSFPRRSTRTRQAGFGRCLPKCRNPSPRKQRVAQSSRRNFLFPDFGSSLQTMPIAIQSLLATGDRIRCRRTSEAGPSKVEPDRS